MYNISLTKAQHTTLMQQEYSWLEPSSLPIHKGGSTFSKLMEREGSKIFLWRFLMMQHKKNLDMFISPLLTNMCYKTTAQMKYKMTGIVIVLIVLIAVLIIHANNKHSA